MRLDWIQARASYHAFAKTSGCSKTKSAHFQKTLLLHRVQGK